jgi:hypothetical protein
VAAVQLGRRIRASVSRFDESTREETSVNTKPNDPLRTFHEAVLNYGVDITKTDPAVSWWLLWQTSGIIGQTSGFARGSRFKLNAPCVRLRSHRFPDFWGCRPHGEAPRRNFFFS